MSTCCAAARAAPAAISARPRRTMHPPWRRRPRGAMLFAPLAAAWLCCLPSLTTGVEIVCSVASQPGAQGDNHTVNTAAFRNAAACCAGRGRPGSRAVLLVPAGVWLTGAFNLSSHTELRLMAGATVAAVHSLSRQQYPAVSPFPSYGHCRDGTPKGVPPYTARTEAVISAFDATDVVISGAGSMDRSESVIDGRGCWWWRQFLSKQLRQCRPQLINFVNCTGIELSGFTARDPPFWNIHLWNSSRAHLHDMRIHATKHPSCAPGLFAANSDGLDVDSSCDVLVERVFIQADDDAVAIKSGMNAPGRAFGVPTERVLVRDSVLISNDFAIGSECSGGCADITLQDSRMSDSNGSAIDLLRVKSAVGRGGYIRNILVSNVTVQALRDSARPPDGFRFDLEGSGTPTDNITVQNVFIQDASGIAGQFYGDQLSGGLRGLRLENVTVGNSSGGWVCHNVVHPVFINVQPPPKAAGGCVPRVDGRD
jgi:hypothetical protein